MAFALKILQEKRIEPEREEIIEILEPILEGLGIGEVEFIGEEIEIEETVKEEEVQETVTETLSEYKTALEEFIECGETMDDFVGWQIDSIMEAEDEETELAIVTHANKNYPVRMAEAASRTSTGRATPAFKSDQDGTKGEVQYAIRYRYGGDSVGDRPFCKKMLQANKLYRFEDLQRMEDLPVNPGFGIGGSDIYSVIKYKGGVNCYHRWERVTFVKQGLKGGIDPRNPNAKQLSESQADERGMTPKGEAKANQKISETRPIDMPNQGRVTMSIIDKIKSVWQ